MGLFGLFGKKAEKAAPPQEEGPFLEDYAGMDTLVTGEEGELLFTAKLLGLEGTSGQLHQTSQTVTPLRETEDPQPVRLRGYSSRKSKAAYLTGQLRPTQEPRIWSVDDLALVKLENDRSTFRMGVKMQAAVTPVDHPGAAEEPCGVLDLSVGGVRLSSQYPHQAGERLLLSLDLTQRGMPPTTLLCQILRVIGQEGDYEYGCCFLDPSEADQDRIVQLLFSLQRTKSGRG